MTPERNFEVIRAKLNEASVQMYTASQRYQATHDLYRAACAENNGKQADDLRLQLHALLDILLDCTATMEMLTRQLLTQRKF